MTVKYLSPGIAGAATLVLASSLSGCGSAPNAAIGSVTGGGSSIGGATVNGGTLTAQKHPFPVQGGSNAQGTATPNTALIVYVPGDATVPMEYSGAGGHAISIVEGTGKATVNLNATLIGGRRIVTNGDVPISLRTNPAISGVPEPTTTDATGANRVYTPTTLANVGNRSIEVVTQVLVSDRAGGVDERPTTWPRLTDATYGLVWVANGNTWHFAHPDKDFGLAAYHAGRATPVAQMPTTATATYTGTFQGNGVINTSYSPGEYMGLLTGDTRLTADFGAGTVSGQISNIRNVNGTQTFWNPQPFGIQVDGRITGNAYQGSAAFSTGGTSTTGGTLNGAFYGPNASETAGAVVVRGSMTATSALIVNNPPPTVVPVTIIGSYGARR